MSKNEKPKILLKKIVEYEPKYFHYAVTEINETIMLPKIKI
jgi:hypothetical protein